MILDLWSVSEKFHWDLHLDYFSLFKCSNSDNPPVYIALTNDLIWFVKKRRVDEYFYFYRWGNLYFYSPGYAAGMCLWLNFDWTVWQPIGFGRSHGRGVVRVHSFLVYSGIWRDPIWNMSRFYSSIFSTLKTYISLVEWNLNLCGCVHTCVCVCM